MTGLIVLPFVLAGLLVAILLACVHASAASPDRELRGLVRDDRLAALVAALRLQPALVLASRCSALRNRMVLDLGDLELEVCCYLPPPRPVRLVTAVYYRSSVGWVIETAGERGPARVHGWRLDIR